MAHDGKRALARSSAQRGQMSRLIFMQLPFADELRKGTT
jgi:hypothetical protein